MAGGQKRVFIIGAGATKDATQKLAIPAPLAREFFKSQYVNELWSNNHMRKYCFANTALNQVIHGFFNAKSKKRFSSKKYFLEIDSSINIEEVYSFLEFMESGDFYFNDEILLIKKAKRELINFLLDVLNDYHHKSFNDELYKRISTNLTENDSILTYNWDCLIESVLQKYTKGKEILSNSLKIVSPELATKGMDYDTIAYKNYHLPYFLKLHGSINWYGCKDKSCLRNSMPVVLDINRDLHSFWHCDLCGSLLELMIIPPQAHKSYRHNRIFSLQAKIASNKLEMADELIIIGYSFPEFDFEANALFRRACTAYADLEWYHEPKKIIVVNPAVTSEAFIERIHNIFSLSRKRKHKANLVLYSNIEDFLKKYEWK